MSESIKPYKDGEGGKKDQVTQMFDNISGNYDILNRVITFGMDVGWRKNVFKIIKSQKHDEILDIATGTGDMAIMYGQSDAKRIVGLDISSGMLEVAKEKIKDTDLDSRISFQIGDAEDLKFNADTFDVASVTYGIRNFEDLEKGLSEILRVLKPNGSLVILETSVPKSWFLRQGYAIHTKVFLPLIGKLFSKDKRAYSYLSESANTFPYGEKLKVILEKVGYKDVEVLPQAKGLSTIYVGKKS
ncbi:MAG: bifunctional demethylmenaquinone methyltransferase/2-methoxy-6-polyprenyl-1,4-benzoquinol methylase UbiE [Saprospiraceae bacterium]|nr:bifunctional demethylmenaquinone methyltransferase/2-methoxy-6-polyprenyl-1,4-benzoquinol methylase UbiE [Bacteroidia bacterium]NNE15178.1 bifunctional demethylmenaquinone methyltransferase/2-methoxy-6-polyprenyl-1,4-benzoquinol methylase UbiE [Saprospiraceae bacterium]NNL93210.1 bifunctional demethylmenaquinone methyltransferase/2-methoxy-6-polyprenyl-1,4-benzoquinol methylase UbiE [Saprospiraceae bacterium]